MPGCFSCFGRPKVEDDEADGRERPAGPARSRPPTGGKAANDKLANALLRHSKAGAAGVLAGAQELASASWAGGLSDGVVRARASALHCCLDSLLAPLLGGVEAAVGRPGRGAEGGWEALQLPDIVRMASSVAASATGCELPALAGGVRLLLGALSALASGCQPGWDTARRTTFANQSVNGLLGMTAIVLGRQVAHDSDAVWAQRADDWRQLAGAFGLDGPTLGVALSPPNKALLVYLLNAAEHGEGKLSLRVGRSSALHEAAAHLRAASKLYKHSGAVKVFPLFIVPGEHGTVEAGEGHGPRKEFFAAAGAGMVADAEEQGGNPPVFTYVRSAGQYHLNLALAESEDNRGLAWAAGWIAAQTVANRSSLGVPLPALLFERLLQGEGFRGGMGALEAFDPEAALAIKNTVRLSSAEFRQMLDLEELAGMTRDEYTQHAAAAALGVGGDAGWIFDAFQDGFWAVLPKPMLLDLHTTAEDLQEMVCGPVTAQGLTGDFTVEKVFRVVLDEELGGDRSNSAAGEEAPAAPLAKALWEVVGRWTPELKRKFVLFCTGSDRLPLPGTELLRVELPFVAFSASDHKKMLGMLPQAHTCENVLELPNYWEAVLRTEGGGAAAEELAPGEKKKLYGRMAKVLEERLQLAITTCDSYGLDEGVGQQHPAGAGALTSHPIRGSGSDKALPSLVSSRAAGSSAAAQSAAAKLGNIRTTPSNTILVPPQSVYLALDSPGMLSGPRREDLAPLRRNGSRRSRDGIDASHRSMPDSPDVRIIDLDSWWLPGQSAGPPSPAEPRAPAPTQRGGGAKFFTPAPKHRLSDGAPGMKEPTIDELISDLDVLTL